MLFRSADKSMGDDSHVVAYGSHKQLMDNFRHMKELQLLPKVDSDEDSLKYAYLYQPTPRSAPSSICGPVQAVVHRSVLKMSYKRR